MTSVWGLDLLKGSTGPPLAEGRWPAADGEVALGAQTMRTLGTSVGETIDVEILEQVVPMTVVGRAVFGDFGFGSGFGNGIQMTHEQLLALDPEAGMNLFFANTKPGTTDQAMARLQPVFAKTGAQLEAVDLSPVDGAEAITTDTLSQLREAKGLPLLLAGILAIAAVGTLAHTLIMSVRRRRRDLAVLKTLGFVRRQVSASVAWQATTLVSIALCIGLPLGVAVGRWAWTLFAERLGVIPVPVVDLPPLLIAIPVTVLLANVIAWIPGRIAAKTQPATILRSE